MDKKQEHNSVEVVEFCRTWHFKADIVGRWVWIKFDNKPSAEVRARLKDFGFRWSRRRGEWSHSCGNPSTRSKSSFHPRTKYGSIAVENEALI